MKATALTELTSLFKTVPPLLEKVAMMATSTQGMDALALAELKTAIAAWTVQPLSTAQPAPVTPTTGTSSTAAPVSKPASRKAPTFQAMNAGALPSPPPSPLAARTTPARSTASANAI